jgi:6,7-dimethyl-8-ribityllumazine synthase
MAARKAGNGGRVKPSGKGGGSRTERAAALSKNTQDASANGASRPRIAVIFSAYNSTITHELLLGACETCLNATQRIPDVFEAPGAYELTGLAMAAARTGKYDGVCALGCIIKGETSHDLHIASAVAHGLTNVTLLTDVPVAFGVLTTNTVAQARARAGLGDKAGRSNKGKEAMHALLATIECASVIEHAQDETLYAPSGGNLPDKARARKGTRS